MEEQLDPQAAAAARRQAAQRAQQEAQQGGGWGELSAPLLGAGLVVGAGVLYCFWLVLYEIAAALASHCAL